jgi:hypothetical protein
MEGGVVGGDESKGQILSRKSDESMGMFVVMGARERVDLNLNPFANAHTSFMGVERVMRLQKFCHEDCFLECRSLVVLAQASFIERRDSRLMILLFAATAARRVATDAEHSSSHQGLGGRENFFPDGARGMASSVAL